MTSLIIEVSGRHIRILSIYAKETTFSVHWSASRVSNLILQPWSTEKTGYKEISIRVFLYIILMHYKIVSDTGLLIFSLTG